jgi:hypothetical protein
MQTENGESTHFGGGKEIICKIFISKLLYSPTKDVEQNFKIFYKIF